jgi:hypothetical protein
MDRKYIESEHIIDRYLSGELTVREAREFEQYCVDHPQALRDMPIPVRLKARLGKHPSQESETGVFQAIPSGVTRAAMEAADEGFDDAVEERGSLSAMVGAGVSRGLLVALVVALIAAVGGVVVYGMRASELSQQLATLRSDVRSARMQAPGAQSTHRAQPVRARPEQATLTLGWPSPPQWLDLHLDVSESRYTQFQVTIDSVENGKIMQIRRIARDSNRELRLLLNSSAFGPGEYLVKIDGYTWRGQVEDVGWVRLDLR